MGKEKGIYLGKSGKIFGPYSNKEIEDFSKTGELNSYTWIWGIDSAEWKPIDSPPPPIDRSLHTEGDEGSFDWEALDVLCRDRFHVIAGKVKRVTEIGCTFISDASSNENPRFACGGSQWLDFWDSNRKKSATSCVRITEISRESGSWNYQLRWKTTPRFE